MATIKKEHKQITLVNVEKREPCTLLVRMRTAAVTEEQYGGFQRN